MITSYEVGAVFKLVNEASPTLEKLARQFKLFDDKVRASMGLLRDFDKLIGGLGGSSSKAASTLQADFGKIDAAITGSIRRVADLKAELASLNVPTPRALAASGAGALPGHFGGRYGGGSNFHGQGPSIHAHSLPIPGGSLRPGGGTAGYGAAAAAFGFYELVKYATNLNSVQSSLRISNVPEGKISEATSLSYQLGEQFGQPVAEVLKTIAEIRNPLGGIDPAMEHIKSLGSAMVVMRSLDSKTGGHTADQVYNLVRSAEFRNAITGPEFDKAIDMMVRADVATQGRVNPQQFFQFSKYAKSALPGLSDEFLYTYGPELAQEFQGSTAGTSLASLYQQVVSGQMRTTGLRLLDGLGEIDDSKAEYDKNGRIVRTKPGANKLGDIFKRDPAEYAERLVADMAGHGITAEGDQRNYLSQIFGNRNAAQMVMTLAYQRQRLDRGAAGIAGTMSVDDAAKKLMATDPATSMRSFEAAWTNLLTSLGSPLLGPAMGAMKVLTAIFNTWSSLDRGLGAGLQSLAKKDIIGAGAWWDRHSKLNPEDPLLKGLIPAPRDFTDPDVISPGGSLKSGGWGGIGAAMSSAVVHDGVLQALVDWSNGSGGGGGLGGGGLGGFGGRYGHGIGGGSRLRGGVGPTNIGWSAGGSTPAERAAFIRHTAASLGVDPDVGLRVAQSEGFYKFTGDHGMSHGDFQLYDGGGLGNVFRKLYPGVDPADPKNWKLADAFALKWAAKHGWGDWHGAARVGIGRMQGIGTYHGAIPPLLGGGGSTRSFGSPFSNYSGMGFNAGSTSGPSHFGFGPHGMNAKHDPQPINIHIDGRKVASAVTYHQTKHAWAPRQAPFHNSYSRPTSPDIQFENG